MPRVSFPTCLLSRQGRHTTTVLIAAVSLWIGTAGNIALWRALTRAGSLAGPQGWSLALALAAAITATTAAFLVLLPGRVPVKIAATVLVIATGIAAHFMMTYGVVIDSSMFMNAVQTDVREVADLINVRMLVTVALLGAVPAVLIWRWPDGAGGVRTARSRLLFAGCAVAFACAALLSAFKPLSSVMRNHKEIRYLVTPLNMVYAALRVGVGPERAHAGPLERIGEDAHVGRSYDSVQRPVIVVLVVGETARSANFSLNGYARDTNPDLRALNVVSFNHVASCGTSTAVSLPCMFASAAGGSSASRKAGRENLLDVIQRAGLAVLWVDNQSGCKGVCDRVPTIRTPLTPDSALCAGGECFDEAMLDHLDDRLLALPAEQRARGVVVVMHQMGSHGPAYFRRSPEGYKRFGPECRSTDLQDCTQEQIINAYDNSIAYTDRFLAGVVRWLDAHRAAADTALVYVSDHGESLGEGNLYLHGLPYALAPKVQKEVPWVTWLSDGYLQRRHLSAGCLNAVRDRPLSHAHYFHSVLGLLDIETRERNPGLDVYGGCVA